MAGLADVTAVVLAGGLGTRLRRVVDDRPKVLADVAGRPFLSYVLDSLAHAGLKTVVLSTGYRAEMIEAAFGRLYGPLALSYSREDSPLGTAGALRSALDRLPGETLLVANGDSLCGANLADFLANHRSTRAAASLVVTEVADVSRYGTVECEASGRVVAFREKAHRAGRGRINAGIYLIERYAIAGLPPRTRLSLETDVFPLLVGRGLFAFGTRAELLDIGTPESYARAEQYVTAAGRRSPAGAGRR